MINIAKARQNYWETSLRLCAKYRSAGKLPEIDCFADDKECSDFQNTQTHFAKNIDKLGLGSSFQNPLQHVRDPLEVFFARLPSPFGFRYCRHRRRERELFMHVACTLFANSKKSALLGCRVRIHESRTCISYDMIFPRQVLSWTGTKRLLRAPQQNGKRDTVSAEGASWEKLSIICNNMVKSLHFTPQGLAKRPQIRQSSKSTKTTRSRTCIFCTPPYTT